MAFIIYLDKQEHLNANGYGRFCEADEEENDKYD